MNKKLNLRNLLMAISLLFGAISFTACDTGSDSSFDYPEDEPVATGLCGEKWVLQNIIGSSEELFYLSYVFDIQGRGICEEEKNGQIETTKFSWKSYNTGQTLHMLVLNENAVTYYTVADNKLRLNPGAGYIFEFVPESQYVDPDNKDDNEETEK